MINKIKKVNLKMITILNIFIMLFTIVEPVIAVGVNEMPQYLEVTYKGKTTYGASSCGNFEVNGKQAFCLEHSKTTPSTGTALTTHIYYNENVRKALYYGWGGPEQWSGFASEAHGIVATSLALSHYYAGDKVKTAAQSFVDFLSTKSVPSFVVGFSKSNVTAYKEGNIQRTETIELVSDMTIGSVTITIPNSVTYVDETHGTRKTGGDVTIYGKTKFHLEAPLNVNLGTWTTGEKSRGFEYQPIVGVTTSSSMQNIGYLDVVIDPANTMSLTVEWMSNGSFKITKVDNEGAKVAGVGIKLSYKSDMSSPIGTYITGADGSFTVENLNAGTIYYQEVSTLSHLVLDTTIKSANIEPGTTTTVTLTNNKKQGYIQVTKKDAKTGKVVKKEGTEFEIISNNTVVGTIKTNSSGVAKSGLLKYGTYTIREKKNPQNYITTSVTKNVNIEDNNKTYPITMENQPVVGEIELKKTDKETGDTPQGDATLKGATYTLKANENILDPADGTVLFKKDETISKKTVGTGSWGDTGSKTLDNNNSIKWTNLPMGNYRVEETKAPTGYLLDNNHVVSITPTSSTKSVEIRQVNSQDQVKKGYIEVTKKDSKTGKVVKKAGTQFEILYKGNVISTITTNANGVAKSGLLVYGTYTVREKTNPQNYIITNITKNANVYENGKTYQIEISNQPVVGEIGLKKTDKETGDTPQGDATLKGATYTLKANENILDPADGSVLFKKDETISKKTVGTGTWGDIGEKTIDNNNSIKWTNLPMGNYRVEETKAPTGYLLDNNHVVSITPTSSTKSVEIRQVNSQDQVKKGYIQVVKKDKETGKIVKQAGTEFEILYKGNVISTITTNSNGVAKSGLLPYGTYEIREKKAPYNYVITTEIKSVDVHENNKVYEIEVSNERVTGQMNLEKTDTITGNKPQGEATLKGAIYGLYARTPILDPADRSIIYNTNQKVAELETNSEGKASIDKLYLGEYFVQEIKPSEGYTLDNTKYDFDLVYENQKVKVITKKVPVKERVISQAFQIIKVSSDTNGEAQLLKGVEFTIKAQKDIDEYGSWEKAPIAKNSEGKETAILVTDEKGNAISERLPYGTYIVRETKVPDDKYKVPDFKVVITEDNDEPQTWRIFNDTSFKSVLAIIKQDIETNKTVKIAGAKFKIKNIETGEYFGYWDWNPLPHYVDTWETDETGTVMTGRELLPAKYQLEEIESPNGYLISSTPVEFEITSKVAYQTLPDGSTPVITIKQKDTSVKGKINVEKRGEVLVDFKEGKFIYEERGLANAKYEVFAKEDIYAPSNDGTILHKKDTVVDTIITNSDGKATTKELPLGEYSVREIEAPKGFILSGEIKHVSLKYKDQNTAIVFDNTSFINNRQKVDITVIKKDYETEETLEGAVFGLYAKNDIPNYKGEVLITEGQLIETAISNNEGKVHFISDLPLTDFEIKEIKAPTGYASSDEVIQVDANYRGQELNVIMLEYEFKDKITKVEVSKIDITNSQEIEGANLIVFEKNNEGAIVDTWVSGQDGKNEDGTIKPHLIQGLEVGKTYVLREKISPYGFAISQDVEFVVQDTCEIQKVTMEDELVYGKLQFNKYGEIFNQVIENQTEYGKTITPVWNESNLIDSEITIYAGENIIIGNTTYYNKDEKVQTLKSDWEPILTKELPVGSYYYVETKVPHGYIEDTNKHYFKIEDTKVKELQVIESTLLNERQKVEITVTKKDADTGVALSGAIFGLYAKEDIKSYKGEVLINAGQLIEVATSNNEGKVDFITDLPLSNFAIKELKAPTGYSSNNEVINVDATYRGQEIKVLNLEYDFKDKITKVEVSKIDITNSEEIEGAYLTIFEKDNEGAIFDTWISGNDGKSEDGTIKPHIVKGLEVGKTYVLRETTSPFGFAISQDVEFVVQDTGEIQSVVMKDELVYGKLKFNKYGEIFNQTITGQTEFGKTESPVWNKSNLLDTEITIYAGQDIVIGNTTYFNKDEKVQTLESDWEPVLSKKLPVGSYYYIETKVPFGYIANTNKHYFRIEDTKVNEVQIIESTLVNERAKFNIDMTKVLEEQKTFINNEAYKDIIFGIYAREDIYDYMGNVAIKNGTMISTTGITEKGLLEHVPDLPIGTYYLKELATNTQYILNDTEYDFEIGYKGPSVTEYTVQVGNEGKIDNELARGRIHVRKIDILDENKKLENVEFNISANEDMSNIITTEKTNEAGIATFNELELGTYYIQEEKQVDGYILNDYIYKVEVKQNGDIFVINCENQPTQVSFSKVDETGTEQLEGATIQIIDKETNEVIEEWVSTKETHVINYLVEGKEYIMKEITAPYGYEIAEEITFVMGDNKKVTMKDMPILKSVRVEKLDKTTKEHIKSNKFVFGIYENKECTKLIKQAGANEYEGTALFDKLRYGTYYIKEIQAPLGYKLSEQVVKIEINDEGVFADGKSLEERDSVYSFVYYNSLLPIIQTGNETNYILLISLGIISLLGIIGGIILLRKKHNEK